MKIAILGCGALGSYYGAKLCRSGRETHFLLRSDYDAVKQNGVQVLSADGDFTVRPCCARHPEEIGVCDLVIIGLKTTGNSALEKLLPPLVGSNTAVLTLQNGLGNEAEIARLIGAEKTLGGLCFVCINRLAPGKIQHIAHGKIVMGEYGRPSQSRTHEIARIIEQSGVPCVVTESIEAAHWEKLVWNIPFNGLGVAGVAGIEAVLSGHLTPGQKLQPCSTSDILLADPGWAKLVRELMMETIHTAQALGLNVPDSVADEQIARTMDMGPYKASTLIDYENGMELELNALFYEPLRQAQMAKFFTPRLANMCAVLKQLNPHQTP